MTLIARRLSCVLVMFLFLGVGSTRARGATADQVQSAVDKARAFLLSQQKAGGQWEINAARVGETHAWQTMQGDTFGGFTSLCTYALLDSGSPANDPAIVSAVNFLKKADIVGTYAIGLRLQVWLLMWQQTHDPQYKDLANADCGKLLTWLDQNKANNPGLWDYPGVGPRLDHSVSQYGVLGLWAAAQMGGEIPDLSWKLLDQRWRDDQFPDGGWAYSGTPAHPSFNPNDIGKPSMTAAGIATLFITQDYTLGSKGLNCSGDIANPNIDNGLAWMGKNFALANDPYTFYGIERIGVASGYKYFGTIDWFSQIADRLIASQGGDGSFGAGLGQYPGETPLTATAFGVLFLARGGAPVMVNKLDYTVSKDKKQQEANWNERPRDAANLARWTGTQTEGNFNWQVVNLGVSVDDLHDAPILYLSGDQRLTLSDADIDKLRQFVVEGGLILGNANCNSIAFANSFKDLGQRLFPKYEFRELGKNHLIYSGQSFRPDKIRGHQVIYGLSNGVRELMLLFPVGDPGRAWQQNATLTNTAAFQIASDVFQYATDIKGLRKKGDSYIVRSDGGAPTQTIAVARLMVGDNPDPEPGGWTRLSAILHNQPYGIGVTLADVKSGDELTGKFQIVHLTGTTAFTLKALEQEILKDFVKKGGTLIIDAAGGSGVFADSAELALREMFHKDAETGLAHPLPLTSPVYNLPDAPIATVDYRRFAKRTMVGDFKAPRILGIEVKGRLAVFFSRQDLSAGVVGEQLDGINGYDPASATALMRNLVLYSVQNK